MGVGCENAAQPNLRLLTIKNSTFNANANNLSPSSGYGIRMDAAGAGGRVVMDNTYVSGNEQGGAYFRKIGDLVISNSNFSLNNGAGGAKGLEVAESKGAATISNAYFLSNTGSGFWFISGGQGASTIANSTFDQNNQSGLVMQTGGNVTLKGVRVRENKDTTRAGAWIDNLTNALAARAVSVQDGIFYNNQGGGLWIKSRGVVSLNHIRASFNARGSGVFIDNCWPGQSGCQSTAGVTLSNTLGSSEMFTNGALAGFSTAGLDINSGGAVSLTGFDAGGNRDYGLRVFNYLGTGSVTVKQTKLIDNGAGGAYILSKGTVTISQIRTASTDDAGSGIEIDNHWSPGSLVSIGDAEVINSKEYGIKVTSSGAISLKTVLVNIASKNNGIYLNNKAGSGSVGLGNVEVYNASLQGVWIDTRGNVSVNGLRLEDNLYGGMYIRTLDAAIPRSVTLYNLYASDNKAYGLLVETRGNILASHVEVYNSTANVASGFGARLDNCIADKGCTGSGSVTINDTYGKNWFHGNADTGLAILSKGAVSLTGVLAGWNQTSGDGAVIDNLGGTASVRVLRSEFQSNKLHGLVVFSRGGVTLDKVIASNNHEGSGALIHNESASIPASVTIYNSDFNANYQNGLVVESKGAITLNNFTAKDNGNATTGKGIILDNCQLSGVCYGSGSILIQDTRGSNLVQNNNFGGLDITTKGSVTISGLLTELNGAHVPGNTSDDTPAIGLYINSQSYVTLSNITANRNTLEGILTYATGKVSLDKIIAAQNVLSGVFISNLPGTTFQPVLVYNTIADGNGQFGVKVVSEGAILLNHVSASYNGHTGLELMNNSGTGGVTLASTLGPNKMIGNYRIGLSIFTTGNIAINNTRVSENGIVDVNDDGGGWDGVYLEVFGSKNNITFTCSLVSGNGRHGIHTGGTSVLTLKLVGSFAYDNNRRGGGWPNVNMAYSFVPNNCGY